MRKFAITLTLYLFFSLFIIVSANNFQISQTGGAILSEPLNPSSTGATASGVIRSHTDDKDRLVINSRASTSGFEGLNAETEYHVNDFVQVHIAVGPSHIIESTKREYQIFDKNGKALTAVLDKSSLWKDTGNPCNKAFSSFTVNQENTTAYDTLADRWILTFTGPTPTAQSTESKTQFCVAISQNGDPLGRYYLYDFEVAFTRTEASRQVAIHPVRTLMAVGEKSYYSGGATSTYNGVVSFDSHIMAFEKAPMLLGKPIRHVSKVFSITEEPYFPVYVTGPKAPKTSFEQLYFSYKVGIIDSFRLHQYKVDWSDPSNASFTQLKQLALPPKGSFKAAFQPNPVGIDVGLVSAESATATRRLPYRNLGTRSNLFLSTVQGITSNNLDQLNSIEINFDENDASIGVLKETLISDADRSLFFVSGAFDAKGNLMQGFTRTSNVTDAEENYPRLMAIEKKVEQSQTPQPVPFLLKAGEGFRSATDNTTNFSNWGAYPDGMIDPSNDCSFYYLGLYMKAANTGTKKWTSYISKIDVDDCEKNTEAIIKGTVTGGAKKGLKGARVAVGRYSTLTDSSGNYELKTQAGIYNVSAAKYPYVTKSESKTLIKDSTVSLDISLALAASIQISGEVTNTFSKYAKVFVRGAGDLEYQLFTYTHPETGKFTLSLIEDSPVDIQIVTERNQGYKVKNLDIIPKTTTPAQNVSLELDGCTAKGFKLVAGNCETIPGQMISVYIVNQDDLALNGIQLKDKDNNVIATSTKTDGDFNLDNGFIYEFLAASTTGLKVVDPSNIYQTKTVTRESLKLSTPIKLFKGLIEVSGTISNTLSRYAQIWVKGPEDAEFKLVTYSDPVTGKFSLMLIEDARSEIKIVALGTEGYKETLLTVTAKPSTPIPTTTLVLDGCKAIGHSLDSSGVCKSIVGNVRTAYIVDSENKPVSGIQIRNAETSSVLGVSVMTADPKLNDGFLYFFLPDSVTKLELFDPKGVYLTESITKDKLDITKPITVFNKFVPVEGDITTKLSPYGKVEVKAPNEGEFKFVTFSHPETGKFDLSLIADANSTIRLTAALNQGYQTSDVTFKPSRLSRSFTATLNLDSSTCTAKGYQLVSGTCTAIAGGIFSAYIVDSNNKPLNGIQLRNKDTGSILGTSIATEKDTNLNDGFLYVFIPSSVSELELFDPSGSGARLPRKVTTSDLKLSNPIEMFKQPVSVAGEIITKLSPYGRVQVKAANESAFKFVGFSHPETGAFSLSLIESADSQIRVTAASNQGYKTTDLTFTPELPSPSVAVSLNIDSSCKAKGYKIVSGECKQIAGKILSAYITDTKNVSLNGIQLRDRSTGEVFVTSVATTEDKNLRDGFMYLFLPTTSNKTIELFDPKSIYITAPITPDQLTLAEPIKMFKRTVAVKGTVTTSLSPYASVWVKPPNEAELKFVTFSHPETGMFNLSLIEDDPSNIRIMAAENKGYLATNLSFTPNSSTKTFSTTLTRDKNTCTSKGYELVEGTCKQIAGRIFSVYVVDASNKPINGIQLKDRFGDSVFATSIATVDTNLNDGFMYGYLPDRNHGIELFDPQNRFKKKIITAADLKLSTPIKLANKVDVKTVVEVSDDTITMDVVDRGMKSKEITITNKSDEPVEYEVTTTPKDIMGVSMTNEKGVISKDNGNDGKVIVTVTVDGSAMSSSSSTRAQQSININVEGASAPLVIPFVIQTAAARSGKLGFNQSRITITAANMDQVPAVTRTDGSDLAVSVAYQIRSLNDAGNLIASGNLNWSDGDSEPKVIDMPTVSTSPVRVQLLNPQGASLGAISSIDVNFNMQGTKAEQLLSENRTEAAAIDTRLLLLLILLFVLKMKIIRIKSL